jgi:hypothetical protein
LQVEVEYVPEKPELDDPLLDDFKAIFEKFTFKDAAAAAAEVHHIGFSLLPASQISQQISR